MADGLKGRGVHLYPDTTPTRYKLLQTLSSSHMHVSSQLPVSFRPSARTDTESVQ